MNMERKIEFADVQRAVGEAYDSFKDDNEGAIDLRVVSSSKAGTFGISVVLTDGRSVDKGDADALFAMGSISRIPLSLVLLTQYGVDGLEQKMGHCLCCSKPRTDRNKVELPFSRHAVRAAAAVQPQGDPEGKYKIIADMIYGLTGCEPSFDDALYEAYRTELDKENAAANLEGSGYRMADTPAISLDLYSRLRSLRVSPRQLATMGATIAADGRNPYSGQYAFDGALAAPAVAIMASHGRHFLKPWLVETGLPAKKSFAGGILAVMPGFGAIAAYSPEVDERGISVKGARAIAHIARQLQLNVFASSRIVVAK